MTQKLDKWLKYIKKKTRDKKTDFEIRDQNFIWKIKIGQKKKTIKSAFKSFFYYVKKAISLTT